MRAVRSVKVAEPTVLFWATKLLTTACGEATSDYLARAADPLVAGPVAGVVLLVLLIVQIRATRYIPALYWATVTMVAVFGTMAADGIHVFLGVPYPVTSTAFAAILAVVLIVWRRTEGTLSIHSITTRRREIFYWLTVGATFALGTAVGDLVAAPLGLGYLASGIVFTVLFVLVAGAWRWLRMPSVAAFWTAYILTRPLGATYADWLALEPAYSGVGLGAAPVAGVLLAGIVVLVTVMTLRRRSATDARIASPTAEVAAETAAGTAAT